MEDNKKILEIELSEEQYAFLTEWQKTHEKELGIEVPLTAMVRKAIDGTMRAQKARSERDSGDSRPPRRDGPSGGRPSFGDRPPRRDGPSGGRPSFGDRPPRRDGPSSGGRPSFGDRPARGPKFDMLSGIKKRKFD